MSAPTPADGTSFSSAFRAVRITFDQIHTRNPQMQAALHRAQAAAAGDVTVLILGETGTGKNLLAQAIHNASRRAAGPYVSVNSSAIPDSLLESELFGHEKGAFTSADRLRKGCFERADQGTLFLDEIGEMTPGAQAKVLHAVEYKQYARVGGDQLRRTNVRLVAATNRPLRELIGSGHFRDDLFYRLAEITVEIPPLRARKEDIPAYASFFLEEASDRYDKDVRKISKGALRALAAHDWPGNVRELRAAIRSAVMLCGKRVLEESDLALGEVGGGAGSVIESSPYLPPPQRPAEDRAVTGVSRVPGAAGDPPEYAGSWELADVEAAHIRRVLLRTNWTKTEAARLLGISRPTLDRKIALYDLRPTH